MGWLGPEEWAAITGPISQPAADPATERVQIAETVAAFEQKAGGRAQPVEGIGGQLRRRTLGGNRQCCQHPLLRGDQPDSGMQPAPQGIDGSGLVP